MSPTNIIVITRRQLLSFCLLMTLIFSLVIWSSSRKVWPTVGGAQTGKAPVILDAGHGGVDSGANSREVKEKEITLDVVLRIRKYLEKKGLPVELTRDSDVDLGGELTRGRHRRDLEARLKIINKGQIAVSIHVNTANAASEQGALILYDCNSEKGKKLAETILQELQKVQKLNHPKPIPRSNIFLLRVSEVPTVLVELGFISNPEEKAKLMQPEFRQKCAEAIGKGILNYFNIT